MKMAIILSKEEIPPLEKLIEATKRVDGVAKKDFQKAIDDWWKRVRDRAKELCADRAYDTGTLYNTIRIVYAPVTEIGFGAFYEITATATSITVDRMLVAGGMLINPKTGRLCDYAEIVHDGYPPDKRAPTYFLTDAIDEMEPELIEIMEKFMTEIENEWKHD